MQWYKIIVEKNSGKIISIIKGGGKTVIPEHPDREVYELSLEDMVKVIGKPDEYRYDHALKSLIRL